MPLYNYQRGMLENLRASIKSGARRVIACLPTGGGKTVIAAEVMQKAAERQKRCLFLVHRRELVAQALNTLHKHIPNTPIGVIASGKPEDMGLTMQVGMIPSLARRRERWRGWLPDLVVIDECHHCRAATWLDTINDIITPRTVVLGLTATPSRLDGKGLGASAGGIFDEIVNGPQISELIASKHLSPYRLYTTPEHYDLEGIKIRMGDYDKSAIERQALDSKRVANAVDLYREKAPGKRAIFFGVSVSHSRTMCGRFRAAGYRAEHLDGELDYYHRDKIVADFAAGKIDVLCNCEIVSEGYDCPAAEVIIDDSPTASLVKNLQRIGRGLRYVEGKEAVILDLAGNYLLHGLPDTDRFWSLRDGVKGGTRQQKAKSSRATKMCEKCFGVNDSAAWKCRLCGAEFKSGQYEEAPVKGGLVEVGKDDGILRVGDVQIRYGKGRGRLSGILSHAWRMKKSGGERGAIKDFLMSAGKEAGYAPGWERHHIGRILGD